MYTKTDSAQCVLNSIKYKGGKPMPNGGLFKSDDGADGEVD